MGRINPELTTSDHPNCSGTADSILRREPDEEDEEEQEDEGDSNEDDSEDDTDEGYSE